jgi:hypothetical protein
MVPLEHLFDIHRMQSPTSFACRLHDISNENQKLPLSPSSAAAP